MPVTAVFDLAGDAHPTLIEIFRIDDGRLAEAWGITEGPDPRISDAG
jgi:predicted SnoaL-like aldol condensation-catalyzing enzyme